MQQFVWSKVKLLAEWLYEHLLHLSHSTKVVILIGQKGVLLGAFKSNRLIAHLFVDLHQQENLNNYHHFLNRFRRSKIFFLLDNVECQLIKELLPTFQSFWRLNSLQKFINENFFNDEIVAGQILEDAAYSEHNTTLAITPYIAPLNILLEYVLEKGLVFQGMYFFDLELAGIISKIASNNKQSPSAYELQIFVLPLGACGLKFIAVHNNNIINAKTISYPVDKPAAYLKGLLSKEISDQLIALKSDIEKFAFKPHLFLLLEPNLEATISAQEFGCSLTFISSSELPLHYSYSLQDSIGRSFTDLAIMNLFSQQPRFLGSNQSLKQLAKFNLINGWMFKPLILIVMLLAANLINIQTTIFFTEKSTQQLYQQNSKISYEYQKIKTQFPYFNGVNLAEVFSLERSLRFNLHSHIDFLEKFLVSSRGAVEIEKIQWQLDDIEYLTTRYPKVKMDAIIRFNDYSNSIMVAEENVDQYLALLKENFRSFDIDYIKFVDKISKIANKTTIPVVLSIKGSRR